MRDSTIFYRSFYEALKELPPTNQAEIYNAIFEYSLNFKLIELSGLSKTIFTLIKPQIDANIKRYESGNKPKQKRKVSEMEAKDKQAISESEANKNVNENKNVNKNNNNKIFTPPLLEDVKQYFTDNGYTNQSAEKAFNYYSVANWVDSKGSNIKNWKQKMQGVWFKDENKIDNKPIVERDHNGFIIKKGVMGV